ncbi:hypothetical protein [Tautonia sociabilis]|nr:hypothetical protein [Tautonia sociabilis]
MLRTSAALALAIVPLSGCGGSPKEGTIMEDQAPEITEANNAMEEFAKSQGKAP